MKMLIVPFKWFSMMHIGEQPASSSATVLHTHANDAFDSAYDTTATVSNVHAHIVLCAVCAGRNQQ